MGRDSFAFDMWEDMRKMHLQGFDFNALFLAAIRYVDDLYLFASRVGHARVMVNELRTKLSVWVIILRLSVTVLRL